MNKILFKVVLSIISILTQKISNRESTKLPCFEIIYQVPVGYESQNELGFRSVYLKDTLIFTRFKDWTIIKLNHKANNKGKNIPKTSSYFLYKKNEKIGYFFENNSTAKFKEVEVDSVYIKQIGLSTLSEKLNDSLYIKDTKKCTKDYYTLHEKYYYIGKKDETIPDSIYLTFANKIKNLDFSISRFYDSLKSSKLISLTYVFNRRYIKALNNNLGKSYLKIEIKQREINYKKEDIGINLIDQIKKT